MEDSGMRLSLMETAKLNIQLKKSLSLGKIHAKI